nr:glycoside hydrolase family 97 N-terminal domain-containing protein [Echinicola strongylocentroti]
MSSPDGNLEVIVSFNKGMAQYTVRYQDKAMLENSPLGLVTNEGGFASNVKGIPVNTAC